MLSEVMELARRLEQQLNSYERLNADDVKRFQDQLAAFQQIQNNELQMLREELKQLKAEIAQLQNQHPLLLSDSAPIPPQVDLTISRRDLLTGNLTPFKKRD